MTEEEKVRLSKLSQEEYINYLVRKVENNVNTENIKVFVERVTKESAISRFSDYQLVDRYSDKTLVFKNVYKREVGYYSQFVKVGILKEDNVISFNKFTTKLKDEFHWYEPDGIYLRYIELESYSLDKATEIINKSSYGYENKVAGYITDDGMAVYYDQYLKE